MVLDGLAILLSALGGGIALTFIVPEKLHLILVGVFSGSAFVCTTLSMVILYRRIKRSAEIFCTSKWSD